MGEAVNGRRLGVTAGPFRIAFVATLGAGLAVAILLAFSNLATVLTYVGLAFFVGLAIDPLVSLLARGRLSRPLALLIVIVGLGALMVGGAFLLAPALGDQAAALTQQVVHAVTHLADEKWVQWIIAHTSHLLDVNELIAQVARFFSSPEHLSDLASGVLAVGSGLVGGVTGLIVVVVLSIYVAAGLPSLKQKISLAVPRSRRSRVIALAREVEESVSRYIGGQFAIAAVSALVFTTVTGITGNVAPLVIGVIAFVGALIPVVGPLISVAFAALTTLPLGLPPAVVVAGILLAYLQVESYILTPRVMKSAVAVPGGIIIVAAITGAALGGILGALVAVPVAAAVMIIFERLIIPLQQAR